MSRLTTNKKLIGLILISAASSLLAGLLIVSGVLSDLENKSWDMRLPFIAQRTTPDPKIAIIMIDQLSLDILAEDGNFWPWPRGIYAPIIEYLRKGEAEGLGIDIIFSEQSAADVANDLALSNSLPGEMPVALAIGVGSGGKPVTSESLSLIRNIQNSKRNLITQDLSAVISQTEKTYPNATTPVLEILKKTEVLGNVSSPNDSDGIFRHTVPGRNLNGIPILTLPFALSHAVSASKGYDLPYSNDGSLAVRFAGPAKTYKTYPFALVLRSFQQELEGKIPQIPASEFKDMYVFLGMSAQGLLDLRPTPLAPDFPGVEFHATALDNLLHNSFIRKASLLENITFAFSLIALIVAASLYIRKTVVQISTLLAIFTGFILLACYLGVVGIWIQLAATILAAIIALVAALVFQYQIEGSNFRFIKQAFRFYVSPEVIEKIIDNPSSLRLGGERRELTIFFSDIAGFTSISESIEPTVLVQLLNLFLTEMTDIILQHGGTVDKYVGDAIIAFWNAPVETPEHALQATKAAIRCQGRIVEMADEFKKFGTSLSMRIGLHTGDVNVGNFGSQKRFNYTVIGDAANLASRIEGVNKVFGTQVLLTEQSYQAVRDNIPCIEVGTVKVIGREEAVTVYTAQELFPDLEPQTWLSMLKEFKAKNFPATTELLKKMPNNNLVNAYLARLQTTKIDSIIWEMQNK